MTTNHSKSDYDYPRYGNKWRNDSHATPNNTALTTNRTKHGPYTIIKKDFGDQKVLYYVPSSYENDYDISQLDEQPVHQEQQKYYSPAVGRRRYHQLYYNDSDDIEELPIVLTRRHKYISPRRPQLIKTIYYKRSPPTEYIYADDYRPKNKEIIEYIVPRQRYLEEPLPIHRSIYVENLPAIPRSPRAPPTPRTIKPLQLNEMPSPRRSKLKQQTPRITLVHETPRKFLSQNNNNQKHMSLKDVLAGNRARRGSGIPKPRREVDEEEFNDPPTSNKNFIKNDFIVHK